MRRAARSTALGSAPTASPPRGCFALGRGATHPPAEVLIDYIGSMENIGRRTEQTRPDTSKFPRVTCQ